jgi:hypothetical protein
MAIPESQLETWSHQGSMAQSSVTYQRIKSVLETVGTPYAGKDYNVFLQGSYGNDTNVFGESDVDVVVRLDACWQSDLSRLKQPEKDAYAEAYKAATYTHIEFKRDVLAVLSAEFGSDVKAGDKAIAIAANGGRRKADVIAAIQYRRYYKFNSTSDQSYAEGIWFLTANGTEIANFPNQHSANLTTKHQTTKNRLKPFVRVLKNLRGRLVDNGAIKSGVAPSYYLEGLLYNVPDDKYEATYQASFLAVINWLQKTAEVDKLVCANEQYYLLRDNSHTCWPKARYQEFLGAAVRLWNEW